jgi:hypothetical protein
VIIKAQINILETFFLMQKFSALFLGMFALFLFLSHPNNTPPPAALEAIRANAKQRE